MSKNQVVPAKPQLRVTTLREQGPKLPLGIAVPNGLARDMATQPWKFKQEKELAKLRQDNQDQSIAHWVSMVLATMYTKLGTHDFAETKYEGKRIIISQMIMGDVWYAYLWLRTQTMGPKVNLELKCPACRKPFGFLADLETTEVQVADAIEQTKWLYEMKEPFEIRGKLATQLLLGQPRWEAMEAANHQSGMGDATAKLAIIRGSIHGITGQDAMVILTEDELDEMSKIDIESIVAQINSNNIGPNMAIEGACPKCQRDFRLPMDWSYDNFFGVSSQSAI